MGIGKFVIVYCKIKYFFFEKYNCSICKFYMNEFDVFLFFR